jgi:hypothetical protein
MGFGSEFPTVITLKESDKITFVGNVPYKADDDRGETIAKTTAYKTFKISVEIYWSPTSEPRRLKKRRWLKK